MSTFKTSTGRLSKALRVIAVAALMGQLPNFAGAQESAKPATEMVQTSSSNLDAIRARGHLLCGVIGTIPGFSSVDSKGVMRGIDADVCRSVAAAIFGDAEKVQFVSLTGLTRFPALQSGEVDMVALLTTWTLTREASLGLEFPSVYFYDGQGFLVKKSSGIKSPLELDGATVCTVPGSTSEVILAEYARAHKLNITPLVLEKSDQIRDALAADRCDAFTTDRSNISSYKVAMGPAGEDYEVLPDVISNEPLGTMIRKGDQRFFDIVRWTHIAMLTAEDYGITKDNVETFRKSSNPDIQRFMGETGDLGKALGLDPEWAVHIVKGVGNFAEMWDRNVAVLGLPRGLNRLVKDGGIQYAPPMR